MERLRELLGDDRILRRTLDAVHDIEAAALAFNLDDLDEIPRSGPLAREDADELFLGEVHGRTRPTGRSVLLPQSVPFTLGLRHNLSRVGDSAVSPPVEGDEWHERENDRRSKEEAFQRAFSRGGPALICNARAQRGIAEGHTTTQTLYITKCTVSRPATR